MTKKTDLPANSGVYTFTIPVRLADTAPVGVNMQNVVYACASNNPNNPTGPNGENICGNPNPPPPPPPDQCDKTNPNSQKDPACIVVPGAGFDLAVKKYVDTINQDAQPGSAVTVNTNQLINYIIRVTNRGPATATGTTTVVDRLPAGVTASGIVTAQNWSCTYSGVTLTCKTLQVVASGAVFTDITVPVRVTATAGQGVTNYAVVHNPNESNPCYTDGRMPSGDESSCTRDPANTDPAVINVPGGGGGGASYV